MLEIYLAVRGGSYASGDAEVRVKMHPLKECPAFVFVEYLVQYEDVNEAVKNAQNLDVIIIKTDGHSVVKFKLDSEVVIIVMVYYVKHLLDRPLLIKMTLSNGKDLYFPVLGPPDSTFTLDMADTSLTDSQLYPALRAYQSVSFKKIKLIKGSGKVQGIKVKGCPFGPYHMVVYRDDLKQTLLSHGVLYTDQMLKGGRPFDQEVLDAVCKLLYLVVVTYYYGSTLLMVDLVSECVTHRFKVDWRVGWLEEHVRFEEQDDTLAVLAGLRDEMGRPYVTPAPDSVYGYQAGPKFGEDISRPGDVSYTLVVTILVTLFGLGLLLAYPTYRLYVRARMYEPRRFD